MILKSAREYMKNQQKSKEGAPNPTSRKERFLERAQSQPATPKAQPRPLILSENDDD